MPPVGFEPTISAGERPQTYALGRVATGTGKLGIYRKNYTFIWLLGVPVIVILTLAAPEPTDNNGRGRLS